MDSLYWNYLVSVYVNGILKLMVVFEKSVDTFIYANFMCSRFWYTELTTTWSSIHRIKFFVKFQYIFIILIGNYVTWVIKFPYNVIARSRLPLTITLSTYLSLAPVYAVINVTYVCVLFMIIILLYNSYRFWIGNLYIVDIVYNINIFYPYISMKR